MNLPTIAAPVRVKDQLGEFASALAHEVRNPLTNINLALSMLENSITDRELKLYLDIIMRSSARIDELVIELLKYREADERERKKYSIHQLLDEVLETAGDRINIKHISVTREYAAPDYPMEVNSTKMKIAFLNIIINAIDSMTSEKRELKLITKLIENKFVIQIEDNGCGISKENLQNIFKPYFTQKSGGLGLGLAATHNILRSNNVKVNVESKIGEGTKFNLVFQRRFRNIPASAPALA